MRVLDPFLRDLGHDVLYFGCDTAQGPPYEDFSSSKSPLALVRMIHNFKAADRFADSLAVVGCAADTLGFPHRRPWEIEPDDLGLADWRGQIWRLLLALPDDALPQPSTCTCSEPDSPKALAGNHVPWCPAHVVEDAP